MIWKPLKFPEAFTVRRRLRTVSAAVTVIVLALLFPWLLPARAPAAGEAPSAADPATLRILERIRARETSLRTFSARFEQIQKSQLFEQIVRSEGIIHYDARGKLLFRVTAPAPLWIIFDCGTIMIHDPEQGRTRRRDVGSRQNLLKRYFGLGESLEELLRRFDIQAVENRPLPGVTLRMIPREDRLSKQVRLISADVDDKSWLPREIFIQRSETEWSRIRLEFTRLDQPLPADAFDVPGISAHPPAATKERP